MSDSPQWYVSVEGQQHGPYTGEQLVDYAQSGNITRESMVWAEGMADWLPAAQVEGLFPPVEVAPAPYTPPAAANFLRPGRGGVTAMAGTPTAGATAGGFPHPSVPAASFGLFIGFFLGGLALMILAAVLSPAAARQAETNPNLGVILIGLMVIGGVCILISGILSLIILHRAWKCLSHAGGSVSPGAAVGMLFIPLFNFYWIFRAIYGFAQDWNRITAAYEDTRHAPRMPEGMFLAYCITSLVFPPLAVLLMFPTFSAMCGAINFIAFRPIAQPGALRFR